MKKYIGMMALTLAAAALCADQTNTNSAGVAAPWVKLPVSARLAAMGEAGSAMAGSLDGLAANPAAMAGLQGVNVSLLHNAWIEDTSMEHAALAVPVGRFAVAAGYDYMNFGVMTKYKADQNTLVEDGSFAPYGMRGSLGVAAPVAFGLTAGLTGSYVSQKIDDSCQSAFVASLGLGYAWRALSAGVAFQNLGSQLDGFDLPRNLKAGVAYGLAEGKANVALDVNLPTADASAFSAGVGGEYWLVDALALRLGYKYQDRGLTSGMQGVSAGLGGRYKWISLDYAFTSLGEVGSGNLISLSAKF